MSIASELTALNGYILDAYDAVDAKGGTIPANKNMASLATAIGTISGGGGGVDLSAYRGCSAVQVGTFKPSSQTSNTITHSLGITPKMFAIYEVTLSSGGRSNLVQDLICQTSTYNSGAIIGALCYNMMDNLTSIVMPSGMVSFSSSSITISSTSYKLDTSVNYMFIVIG